jgi:hypothetical protein
MARSWLINLLEGSIYTWDHLSVMFIRNFQGTYEHPSTAETLNTIRQTHDESLWDYVKHFCNASNAISYIQDMEIINAFHDGVSDIKTMEETHASMHSRPGLDSLSPAARGPRKRPQRPQRSRVSRQAVLRLKREETFPSP